MNVFVLKSCTPDMIKDERDFELVDDILSAGAIFASLDGAKSEADKWEQETIDLFSDDDDDVPQFESLEWWNEVRAEKIAWTAEGTNNTWYRIEKVKVRGVLRAIKSS
jgi:hypothetical protein